MSFSDQFFRAIGIAPNDRRQVAAFAATSGVPPDRLRHYNDANVLPSGDDLTRVLTAAGISELELILAMGRLTRETLNAIQANAATVARLIEVQRLSDAQADTQADTQPDPQSKTGADRSDPGTSDRIGTTVRRRLHGPDAAAQQRLCRHDLR